MKRIGWVLLPLLLWGCQNKELQEENQALQGQVQSLGQQVAQLEARADSVGFLRDQLTRLEGRLTSAEARAESLANRTESLQAKLRRLQGPPSKGSVVQVGAKPTEQEAILLRSKIASYGYSGVIEELKLTTKITYYRVRVGDYKTKAEAEKAAKEIAERAGVETWVAPGPGTY